MMKRIVLLGAGGHARVVWDTLELIRNRENCRVVAVLDDNAHLWGRSFMRLKIEGPVQAIESIKADAAIIAIGDNRARRQVYEIVKSFGIGLLNVIHPAAFLSDELQLGTGIVAFANVVVHIGTRIGDNVILNTACTVDHDCIIGAHAHLAPGVHVAGGVSVGEGTLMGIASAAIPNVMIGRWATIGAGGIVTESIPDQVTAVGVPARILK